MKGNLIGGSLLLGIVASGCFIYLLVVGEPNWILFLPVAATAAVVLDRLGLWMESRGWIYYRRTRGSVAIGHIFLQNLSIAMASLIKPDVKNVEEAKKDHDGLERTGDPPIPGGRRNDTNDS